MIEMNVHTHTQNLLSCAR